MSVCKWHWMLSLVIFYLSTIWFTNGGIFQYNSNFFLFCLLLLIWIIERPTNVNALRARASDSFEFFSWFAFICFGANGKKRWTLKIIFKYKIVGFWGWKQSFPPRRVLPVNGGKHGGCDTGPGNAIISLLRKNRIFDYQSEMRKNPWYRKDSDTFLWSIFSIR